MQVTPHSAKPEGASSSDACRAGDEGSPAEVAASAQVKQILPCGRRVYAHTHKNNTRRASTNLRMVSAVRRKASASL